MTSRSVVEMAKGVIAETQSVDTQEAFNRLRDYAHEHHQHLADVARDVVSSRSLPVARQSARIGDLGQ